MDVDKIQQEINLQVNEEMTTGNYRAYDFRLARYIGLEQSILLTYLCDQDKYINKSNVGAEFYKQKKFIEFFTGLTSNQQTLALKKLKQLEIVDVVKKGMPAKNYFKINYNKIRGLKKLVVDEFYNEIEKYDYYKHEFDSDEEILKNANEKSVNGNTSSDQETKSVVTRKPSDIINNKEPNNLDSFNSISKDISLKDNSETVVHNTDEEIYNLDNKDKKDGMDGIDVFSGIADKSALIPKTPAPQPCEEKPKKKKGGLAPLYDMVDEKYDKKKYGTLNAGLKTYLKSHLGIRRLPDEEKWKGMLRKLEEYSTVQLSGAVGGKFIETRALNIVDKAIKGKNGVPYMDFDDIYKNEEELMEPTFNLNRDFTKGY